MRIVVVGAGKLGYSIAELLSHEQFDIVVVDHDEERLEVVRNTLDVLTILANGASPVTMDDPDIHGADLLVACTATDEVNLVTCILAKKHGIKYTAVRIRDMQFLTGAKDYLKKNFDIDLVINPEMITAREINRILLTPAALNVEDFANGKVRLFETKITRHSPLVNVPFKNMNMPPSVLVGMIFRDQRMIIPHGDDRLYPHDNAYFIGDAKAIEKFSENFVPSNIETIERVIIIGAGRSGRFLAPMLDKEGFQVKVFDKDHERCLQVAELMDDGLAIHGDGTDIDLLEQEGIADADVVICLTDDDRLNLMLALIAKHLGAKKDHRPRIAYRIRRPDGKSRRRYRLIDTIAVRRGSPGLCPWRRRIGFAPRRGQGRSRRSHRPRRGAGHRPAPDGPKPAQGMPDLRLCPRR